MTKKQQDTSRIKWDALLRYRLIEIIVLWEGRLTTNHLCNSFDIGRQQASRDINEYRRIAPNNIRYDRNIKGYVPSTHFKAQFTKGTADEYLHLLDVNRELSGLFVERLDLLSEDIHVLKMPIRPIPPDILRPLVRAIREKRRVEVFYTSMSNPKGEERIIVPHTLISSGLRWHVRAFCEKSRQFRDFVLSRFQGKPELLDISTVNHAQDSDWHKLITLQITANPKLNPDQRKIIAADFGLNPKTPILKYEVRAALAQYALDLLQVATKSWEKSPLKHPIVLKNFEDVSPFLYKSYKSEDRQ